MEKKSQIESKTERARKNKVAGLKLDNLGD